MISLMAILAYPNMSDDSESKIDMHERSSAS